MAMSLRLNAIISALVIGSALTAGAARAGLVAQWTFNTGSLTSEVGGYTLNATGWSGTASNNYHTFNADGTLTVGPGRLLNVAAINSATMPELKTGLTIWARFKIEGPSSGNAPVFGLINSTSALSGNYVTVNGAQMREKYAKTAAAWLSDGGTNPTVKFTGITDTGIVLGPGSNTNRVTLDTYITTAITVSDTGSLTYTDRTNGNTVSRLAGNVNLSDFQSFAIGRLWSDAANVVTVDEVRIYNSVLSDAEIDALSATPIPEAASLGFLAIGGAALLRRRR